MSATNPNSKFTLNAAFFQEIKEDHQHLQSLLQRLRELSNQPSALGNHKREYVSLVTDLLDQLAFHFTLEEAYGYFEDALERAPRFHAQAGQLRGQHAQLFVMCRELVDSVTAKLNSQAPDLDAVVEEYLAFDRLFQAHESAELSLIMDAINLDVGVGD